jgi:hypothetical protein
MTGRLRRAPLCATCHAAYSDLPPMILVEVSLCFRRLLIRLDHWIVLLCIIWVCILLWASIILGVPSLQLYPYSVLMTVAFCCV